MTIEARLSSEQQLLGSHLVYANPCGECPTIPEEIGVSVIYKRGDCGVIFCEMPDGSKLPENKVIGLDTGGWVNRHRVYQEHEPYTVNGIEFYGT